MTPNVLTETRCRWTTQTFTHWLTHSHTHLAENICCILIQRAWASLLHLNTIIASFSEWSMWKVKLYSSRWAVPLAGECLYMLTRSCYLFVRAITVPCTVDSSYLAKQVSADLIFVYIFPPVDKMHINILWVLFIKRHLTKIVPLRVLHASSKCLPMIYTVFYSYEAKCRWVVLHEVTTKYQMAIETRLCYHGDGPTPAPHVWATS